MIIEKAVEDLKRGDLICVGWSTKDRVTTWTRLERVLSEPQMDSELPGHLVVNCSSDDLGPNQYRWARKTKVGVSIEFTDQELTELIALVYKKHESIRKDRRRKIQPSVRALWMVDLKDLLKKLESVQEAKSVRADS